MFATAPLPGVLLSCRWVCTNLELEQACDLWSAFEFLGVDTEFVREKTYYPQHGLIQVRAGDDVFLVDPLPISDWTPLARLFASPVCFIMHACSEDLDFFQSLVGTLPRVLFDTQMAAAFCDLGPQLGYQALLRELLEVEVDKGETRSNWLARPLSEKQLTYAANDVVHLPELHRQLSQRLELASRRLFFEQDMQRIALKCEVDPDTVYRRVKGAFEATGEMPLRRLRALAKWREQQCQRLDRPRRFILDDATLLQLALHGPTTEAELEQIDVLPKRQFKRLATVLIETCYQSARELTPAPEPVVRLVDAARGRQLLKHLRTAAEQVAQQIPFPATVLYSRRLMEHWLLHRLGLMQELPESWCGWRQELLENAFEAVITEML